MIDVRLSIVNSNPEIFRIISVDENINLQVFMKLFKLHLNGVTYTHTFTGLAKPP